MSSTGKHATALCAVPEKKGVARCFAQRRTDVVEHQGVQALATVSGYGPADLASAYGLPANGGAGQTVAIVDAYDDPNAEADLAIYRSQYGLPACTTANGCFRKADQKGGTNYPTANSGWSGEISLDLDMVSAVAPQAHILLVEANSPTVSDLGTAVNEAVSLGAKYVSNSYGGSEGPTDTSSDSQYFNHPGVAITASAGDSGYGVEYPAASQYVTSVGGTSLTRASNSRGWSESVWSTSSASGTGSGCSHYDPKPSWQKDTGCSNRTIADVSAVADPATGVAVYDTFQMNGWNVFGGTSAASPIIASVYADAGTPAANTNPASYPYANTTHLNDVTTGSNGSCTPTYLCTAGPGYDGPTGLGTPNGLAAFTTGPHGTVTGTVTDSSTNAPLAGARVTVGGSTYLTDASGHYSALVPVGTYSATAVDYAYATMTISGVTVTDGGSATENFALAPVTSSSTVSGTVADGSGHHWPLYASITVDGAPGGQVIHTDPYTGHYSLTLPQEATYTLHVAANYPGYQAVTTDVPVGTSNANADVSVPVDVYGCTAPGYTAHNTGTTQTCDPVPGGLVAGGVTDANTNKGVVGATVTSVDKPAEHTTTTVSPNDPNVSDGYYWMFSSLTGTHDFTAAKRNYVTTTAHVNVAADAVTQTPLTLKAGRITITPASVSLTVPWQGKASQVVTVNNTGTAPATVTLGEQAGGMTPLTAQGAPTMRIAGTYSPLFLDHKDGASHTATGAAPNTSVPAAAPWTAIADYAPGQVADNGVVSLGGKIYSAFGTSGAGDYDGMYAYDPTTASWSRLAGPGDERQKPAMAVLNGKIYATGGWDINGVPVGKTVVYDPATNAWTTAAANPDPFAGSGVAVVGGKMYVAGGCSTSCGATHVMVYDPATDTWSRAADYPEPVSWESCGAISGELYCAGGSSSSGSTRHTYVYDPQSNSWSSAADMPIDLWGSGYTTSEGRLLVSGGVTGNNATITNQGFSYEPASDTWTPIPNSNNAVYRGGSACGFYKIGGLSNSYGFNWPVASAEVLPGTIDCGDTKDVSWLAPNPKSLTIAPGASATVTVTVDASVPDITQPGTYTAAFVIAPDTPYPTPNVPVSMTVDPPKDWGKITGTVTGPSGPMPGAQVQITTKAAHYTVTTDASGHYQLWLDAQNSVQVICSNNGYQPQTTTVTIRKGATTTQNFALQKL